MERAGDEPAGVRHGQTESRGFTIRYIVLGEGPPVLLLPGMGARAAMWFDYGHAEALAEDYSVFAPDVLGHGRSAKPYDPAAYREPDVALDALAVLEEEGIDERVRVWGYSRGARLGYMLASEAPERVRCLVAGATPLAVPTALVSQFMAAIVEPLLAEDWDAYWQSFGVPIEPEFREMFEADNDLVALGHMAQGTADAPYEFEPARIEAPCLLYVGGEDPFADLVRNDAELLGAELAVLPGMSHMEGYRRLDLILPQATEFLATH